MFAAWRQDSALQASLDGDGPAGGRPRFTSSPSASRYLILAMRIILAFLRPSS